MKTTYLILKDNTIQSRISSDETLIGDLLKEGETFKELSECKGNLNVGNKYDLEGNVFYPPFVSLNSSPIQHFISPDYHSQSIVCNYNFSQNINSFDTSSITITETESLENISVDGSCISVTFTPSQLSPSMSIDLGTGTITSIYNETIEASSLPLTEIYLVSPVE